MLESSGGKDSQRTDQVEQNIVNEQQFLQQFNRKNEKANEFTRSLEAQQILAKCNDLTLLSKLDLEKFKPSN